VVAHLKANIFAGMSQSDRRFSPMSDFTGYWDGRAATGIGRARQRELVAFAA